MLIVLDQFQEWRGVKRKRPTLEDAQVGTLHARIPFLEQIGRRALQLWIARFASPAPEQVTRPWIPRDEPAPDAVVVDLVRLLDGADRVIRPAPALRPNFGGERGDAGTRGSSPVQRVLDCLETILLYSAAGEAVGLLVLIRR